MKAIHALLLILVNLFSCAAVRAADAVTLSFDDQGDVAKMRIEGDVSLEAAKNRAGGGGAALSVPPGAKAVWSLRDTSGSGQVTLWVFDDGSAPPDPKQHAAGPMWGLVQEAGPVLTVGAIYAPYLSGNTTYAASDLDLTQDERAWWKVQYLGLQRKPGWHKWTFAFDAHKGLTILHDDQALDARQFNWNKTRLRGFAGVGIFGDTSGAKQTVWVDDIQVELGPPAQVTPLWPPPPPPTLVTVPPPAEPTATPYAAWAHGPSQSADYFPIAVWLQDPRNAQRFKAAGINLYVGLWAGPTDEQLAALKAAGMSVICSQNAVGRQHLQDQTIVGWMHGDEPDNAQSLGQGKGYGPPIPAQKIVESYQRIAAADPSRPVLLNLGQGVAWDGWHGRGVRTNHPEDYPDYVKGCDIASFDIYPAVHDNDAISGNLWYVAQGVSRLRQWTGDQKVVWNCIECTRIGNPNVKPTPHQVRAEVWMAIIHGSRGLIYFVHQFRPSFIEAGLLADAEMLAAVTAINQQIHALAGVINSPTIADAVVASSSAPHVPIHVMLKRHAGATYLFAVSLYQRETQGTFQIAGLGAKSNAEVLGEDRTVPVEKGQFTDKFAGYDVHLYKIQ